jgi:hypothetical protein
VPADQSTVENKASDAATSAPDVSQALDLKTSTSPIEKTEGATEPGTTESFPVGAADATTPAAITTSAMTTVALDATSMEPKITGKSNVLFHGVKQNMNI